MGDDEWQEVSYKKRRSVFDRLGNTINVYVSNFPSHLTVRELSNICGKKGTVVDVYIAKHRNKFGQMFGFVRFSGVQNSENLIDSLKKVWIGKLCLHANAARFDKSNRSKPSHTIIRKSALVIKNISPNVSVASKGVNPSHSFANAVQGEPNDDIPDSGQMYGDASSNVIVSQEDNNVLNMVVLGCYKDFRVIANSNIICRNEGFEGVDVKYLGGLWVMFIFHDTKARDSFLQHEGILSWFSSLVPWHDDFVVSERLVWLEIEGVPFKAWNNDTFKSICKKWGEVLFIDDTDTSNRYSIRLCIKSSHTSLIFASTLVTLFGVTYAYRVRELCCWTPNFVNEAEDSKSEFNSSHAGSVNDDEYLELKECNKQWHGYFSSCVSIGLDRK